jgi:ABC-type oligopeptide transport system substrate-binding subunit
MIPPGTAPSGAYNPSIQPIYSFDLTKMASLIQDACKNPLTSFVDVNGHPYPAGKIDNSCNPSSPKTVEFYVSSGAQTDQRIMAAMAGNLNKVSGPLGVTFTIVPVPGGQRYTLASEHQIYLYEAGWIADYNYLIDWLGPMFLASGTYPAWHNFNYTAINNLVNDAFDADRKGDLARLISDNNQIQNLSNSIVEYMYMAYAPYFEPVSSFAQGDFYNEAYGGTAYFASWSYGTMASST